MRVLSSFGHRECLTAISFFECKEPENRPLSSCLREHQRVFLFIFAVSAALVVATLLLLRKPPVNPAPLRAPASWSLRLRAEQSLIIPPAPRHGWHASIECDVALPSEVWAARRRLWLVLTAEDGREWRNTFDALDQPEGMSISPAFDPTPPPPLLTTGFLTTLESDGTVETTERANVGLLDLPRGIHRYRARAVLDALQSDELLISITVG